MNKFPVLISIPHGGARIPEEINGKICLSPKDLFDDGDAFTREIYGINENVLALVETDIARAVVDLNRETNDLPPENPDGIVKTFTCHGKPVYKPENFPDDSTIETLIQKYYRPYHKQIQTLVDNPQAGIQLALDCHTMEPTGPSISPDQGKERPLFCLGNNHGKSCPDEWAEKMANCLRESFDLREDEATINRPFAGGFITRKYGANPIPWLQIEMNRKLYLADPWFNKSTLEIDRERLDKLKEQFKRAIELFFAEK